MDGVYIDDSSVKYNKDASSPIYYENCIETSNVPGIISRNHLKRDCLNVISAKACIWNDLPYQAYFMSCNLDHVLYNRLNLSDEEKELLAFNFAKQYKDDLDLFRNYIFDSSLSLHRMSYRESWEYIKKNDNSLKRYTNFGLCMLDDNKES